ncbi:MAG: DapH/DapD/GlmU-related protein [Devosia sp.]|nr:DapH/DapD/GlmU-related protein [Devosia sp.]
MTRLSDAPLIDETARVTDSVLGRYTEVGARTHVTHSSLGDYSYAVNDTQIAYAQIGRFANIASQVRIYASRHPMDRASLHHFTYRSAWYFDDAADDQSFFGWRASNGITIGHDTWIGHGAVVMPAVKIGNGAVIGSGAVVTRDVPAFAIAVGSPARVIKQRFPNAIAARLEALAWWDWEHSRLRGALEDFRSPRIEAFLEKHGG